MMTQLQRLIKYAIEGIVVAMVAHWFPSMNMKPRDIAMIALTAASTFAVLDFFAPTIASSARTGTGLSIGAKLGGFGV